MWFALTQPPYGTSMPQSGRRPQHQTEKNSVRAYVFRFALELGNCSMQSACLKRGHEQTHAPHLTNALFNQLVGAIEQLSWDSQAKRLSGVEIDDQLEFCGLLNWQIRRAGALKNFVDV
jgi:hypothetical protein